MWTFGKLRIGGLALAISVCGLAAGCRSRSSESADSNPSLAADVGVALATGVGGSGTDDAASADGGPAEVRELGLEVRAVAADGTRRPISVDAPNELLQPETQFELEMPRMADVRVRLFDESDRIVPSNDRLEIGSKTRYLLVPAAPLTTGSKYTLVVDGLASELATDVAGVPYAIVRIPLKTVGEKPPPPPKRSRGKRKKGR